MEIKILTEGGRGIGLGHISRCSSLYEEIASRNISVELIIHGDFPKVSFLENKNYSAVNWLNYEYVNNNITHQDYVIIDSYLATKEIYDLIQRNSNKVMFIDDNDRLNYPKGLIVQPRLEKSSRFDTEIHSIMKGSDYVILRSPFKKVYRDKIKEKIDRVLVIMGGMDVKNITSIILNEMHTKYPELVFDVVVNKKNEKNINYKNINFYTDLSAEDVKDLMLKVDVAVTAAGQTVFELMATQTPFIAIKVAANQMNNIQGITNLISSDLVIDFEDMVNLKQLNPKLQTLQSLSYRQNIINTIEPLIDGLGSKRIIDNFLCDDKDKLDYFIYRHATHKDIENVFKLSNQKYVRDYSINNKPIQWDDHLKWFEELLNNEDKVLYILSNSENEFLGQIRFDINESKATISISLSEILKGKGYGKQILTQAIGKILSERTSIDCIAAIIHQNNIASKKIFESLDFVQIENKMEKTFLKYLLKRGDFNAY